jgi:hypothetical protein
MSEETTRIGVGAAVVAGGDDTTVVGDRPSAGDRASPRRRPKWTWQGVLAFATAFTGASAVLLHLVGNALHKTYFSQWGIDTGPFPKSSDWLVIMGYYGIWSALARALLDAVRNWYFVFMVCVGLVLYVGFLVNPWKPTKAIDRFSRVMANLPKLAHRSLALLFSGTILCIAAMWAMATMFVLIGIPAKIGRSIGEEFVQIEVKDFALGCEASKRKCIRLLKDGSPVGEGYLLESSQTHIAFLDVSMQRVRVVLRENLELQPMRLPVDK